MRKIIVLSFISLDGVLQAPGGPKEDPSGGFKYGGWVAPYFTGTDKAASAMMERQMQPSDLLLGRKTYDIFAGYWPRHADLWPGITDVAKYVVSRTLQQTDWNNSVILRDVGDIRRVKATEGSDLHVYGSGNLAQTLFSHDLVDELWLKIYPLTLGPGKRLFDGGTIPAAFELTESLISQKGVIFANYRRAGEVQTGRAGPE